jgi:hypothetical protein
MQLGRFLSIGLILLAAAISRPVQELSTEIPLVNEEAPQLSLGAVAATPFRCDSARARDCFEMFQRHNNGVTVAARRPLDRFASVEPSRTESVSCGLNVTHRSDQCLLLRSGR